MWCPECNEVFDDNIKECPFCGGKLENAPNAEWSLGIGVGEKPAVWPKDENGWPVKEMLLVSVSASSLGDEMICSMLSAYGIPTLKKYPNNGEFGKIIFGSVSGVVDICVPETMHGEALELLKNSEDLNDE